MFPFGAYACCTCKGKFHVSKKRTTKGVSLLLWLWTKQHDEYTYTSGFTRGWIHLYNRWYMGVSLNGGTPNAKNTPKSWFLVGKQTPLLGKPTILGNPHIMLLACPSSTSISGIDAGAQARKKSPSSSTASTSGTSDALGSSTKLDAGIPTNIDM